MKAKYLHEHRWFCYMDSVNCSAMLRITMMQEKFWERCRLKGYLQGSNNWVTVSWGKAIFYWSYKRQGYCSVNQQNSLEILPSETGGGRPAQEIGKRLRLCRRQTRQNGVLGQPMLSRRRGRPIPVTGFSRQRLIREKLRLAGLSVYYELAQKP